MRAPGPTARGLAFAFASIVVLASPGVGAQDAAGYYWSKDRKVGDTGGHGFRDAWLVAQP
jgi:hypothetical protein